MAPSDAVSAVPCDFEPAAGGSFVCRRCGRVRTPRTGRPARAPKARCPAGPPPSERELRLRSEARRALESLPGYQLAVLITAVLGQEAMPGCGCGSMIAAMNAWGVAGCREHLDEIVDRLVTVATEKDWLIQPEAGEAVPVELIGTPVCQTLRCRAARVAARVLATTAAGAAVIRGRCRWLIELAVARAEWAAGNAS